MAGLPRSRAYPVRSGRPAPGVSCRHIVTIPMPRLAAAQVARAWLALLLVSLPFVSPELAPPLLRRALSTGSGPCARAPELLGNPLTRRVRDVSSLATAVAVNPNLGPVQAGIARLNQVSVGISERVWSARNHLLAGAMGRCVAVSMMFPIDTVKTRLQMFGRDCCTVWPPIPACKAHQATLRCVRPFHLERPLGRAYIQFVCP
jgi:hypothetical protein